MPKKKKFYNYPDQKIEIDMGTRTWKIKGTVVSDIDKKEGYYPLNGKNYYVSFLNGTWEGSFEISTGLSGVL